MALGLLVLASCGKKDDGGQNTYTCELAITKAVHTVTGQASGADEATVKEEAWKAVCAKLPAADQESCRDDEKFEPRIAVGKITTDASVTYSISIKLLPKLPQFEAEGTSTRDQNAACDDAIENACKKAGAGADCVKRGDYQRHRERD